METVPVLDPPAELQENTPCLELQKLLDNAYVHQAIENCQDYLDDSKEYGYNIMAISLGNPNDIGYFADLVPEAHRFYNRLAYIYGGNVLGGIHTHQDDDMGFPIFSPQDLFPLYEFSQNYMYPPDGEPDYSIPVHVLVSSHGVYALKIKDFTKFEKIADIINDYNDANQDGEDEYERFNKKLENRYSVYQAEYSNIPNGSPSDYQGVLLAFLQDQDLGVELYKANNDLTAWNKLTLNNGIVNDTPCN